MAEKLKDIFLTSSSIEAMAVALIEACPDFDKKRFIALVFDQGFAGLELKARMRHTTECLRQVLPESYVKALSILKKAAPDVKGFEAMCLPDYVELYGFEDWDLSLDAMALFTRYSSSEFAIRPYIIKDCERTMAYMLRLAENEDAGQGFPGRRRFQRSKKIPLPCYRFLKNSRMMTPKLFAEAQ